MSTSTKRNPKGQGSFTENPDGTITYRKGVGNKSDGKRKTLTVTAANRTMCIKLMKQKEQKWEKENSLSHLWIIQKRTKPNHNISVCFCVFEHDFHKSLRHTQKKCTARKRCIF